MRLIKDILIFQCETTGNNPDTDQVIQLAGILLDKENLLEKKFFNSFVKTSFLDNTLQQHASQLGVTLEAMRKSPKTVEVVRQFQATFGTEPLLASFGLNHPLFLKQMFRKAMQPFDYQLQSLDIWTLGYIYTLHYGIKKIPSQETLREHFKIKIANRANALDKVRGVADIFRKIING